MAAATIDDFTRLNNREISSEGGGTVRVPTYVELPKNNMILWLTAGFYATLMIESTLLYSLVRVLTVSAEKMFSAWLAAGHPTIF